VAYLTAIEGELEHLTFKRALAKLRETMASKAVEGPPRWKAEEKEGGEKDSKKDASGGKSRQNKMGPENFGGRNRDQETDNRSLCRLDQHSGRGTRRVSIGGAG
jgi:hypothetical protein